MQDELIEAIAVAIICEDYKQDLRFAITAEYLKEAVPVHFEKTMRQAKVALEVINTRARQKNKDGLLPCPFCGSYNNSFGSKGGYHYFINCCDCLASTNVLIDDFKATKEEAIEVWNARAAPPEWLPIESAQFDSVILTYSPANDWNSAIMAAVRVGVDISGGKIFSLEASDCQTGCGDIGNPTHYQPLPQPPKIGK